ncbi:MAG: M14 family zinc carboxypeptidase [Planctomycetota bacterium]
MDFKHTAILITASMIVLSISGCAQRLSRSERVATIPPEPEANWEPVHPTQVHSQRTVRLGSSVEGRPLDLTILGQGRPTIFIMAGIHGDEPNSVGVARALLNYLKERSELWAGGTIGILPAANPDGLTRQRRTNVHKVDLNRNFPARNWKPAKSGELSRGPRPSSEPETRAIENAIRLLKPDCIVSIHAISRGRVCNNYDGPARQLAVLLSRYNRYPPKASIGYPTPGSFGSWAGVDQQIPTITLELPKGASNEQCWEVNRAALLALIKVVTREKGSGGLMASDP